MTCIRFVDVFPLQPNEWQAKYQWELDIPFPTTKYGPPSNDHPWNAGLKSELKRGEIYKSWKLLEELSI